MRLLTKKQTDDLDLDFRNDPTLAKAREQIGNLNRRLADVKRETEAAQQAMFQAHEALEDALLDELLERGSAQAVESAKTAYQRAEATYARLKEEQGPIERGVTLLQSEFADLERVAMARALPRFQSAYADAVARLAKTLEEAATVNADVLRLARLGRELFAPQFLIDHHVGEIPDLAWRELIHNPNADDGGRLGHWRKRAEEVLHV